MLLIFFLVTTTISADKGILRQLPAVCDTEDCTAEIPERNLLQISMNENQQIMIKNELVELAEVASIVENFIDNNGISKCDYCEGEQSTKSSDHPKDAAISLSHDAFTSYESYIALQDEITKAYYNLRIHYAKRVFDKIPSELSKQERIEVQKAYPFKVSEIMVKRNFN